jgi:4-amino-4-deoxy-L-arabinose transferase-like glycosyltransferase
VSHVARVPIPGVTRAWASPLVAALGVAVALYGAAVRALPFFVPAGELDSDEAVVGLMAKQFLRGDFDVFYWGQPYGGTPEVFVDAVFRALFGDSLFVLRLPNLVYSVVAAVLVWKLARELLDDRRALVAALCFWSTPALLATFGVREMLFYSPTLVVGLLVALAGVRAADAPTRWWPWIVMGLGVGLGFWMSGNIAYFAVPVALFLVLSLRRLPARALAAVPAFFLGSWPWWWWNLAHGFDTIKQARAARVDRPGVVENLELYASDGLRVALGLWTEDSEHGLWRVAAYVAVGVLVAAFVVVGGKALAAGVRLRARVPLDVLGMLTAPLVYAILPFRYSFVVPRYFVFVWPFASIILARLAVGRRATATVVALAIGTAVLTAASYVRTPGWPPDTEPLKQAMFQEGVTHAFADYWLTYRILFETDERLVLSPYQFDRRPAYTEQVRAAPQSAYVFEEDAADQTLLVARAQEYGLTFRRVQAGAYVIYVVNGQLFPEQVVSDRPLNGF